MQKMTRLLALTLLTPIGLTALSACSGPFITVDMGQSAEAKPTYIPMPKSIKGCVRVIRDSNAADKAETETWGEWLSGELQDYLAE